MANKYAGEISIRLDRVRALKFDLNAMAEFQMMAGISIDAVFRRAGEAAEAAVLDEEKGAAFVDGIGYANVRLLLWAALLHEEENLTVKDAGKLMCFADGDNPVKQFGYLLRGLMDAWWLSRGTSRAEVEENVRKAVEEASKKKADIEPATIETPNASTGMPSPKSSASIESTPSSPAA